ncbi:MAG: acyltransferase [Coxiellaceae bacterium]|nr:acyltransferase [Coxiellaceae bacterium]
MRILRCLQASLLTLLLCLSTVLHCLPMYFFILLKMIPIKPWQNLCSRIINQIATSWAGFNNVVMHRALKTRWQISGIEGLKKKDSYLVIANHQSWLDIVVLQNTFSRKIPFLKFFIKDQLKWIPVIGWAWWGLDFPFMKRYSKALLAKKPHLRGKDLETTRKACQKFKTIPTSVMNFVEGTRFKLEKSKKQNSPYGNLLIPKAGGVAYVLSAMGQQIDKILNVTIVYSGGPKSLWQFLSGEVSSIKIHVEQLQVDAKLIGDYFNDKKFKDDFQTWLNNVWHKKQLLIEQTISES